MSNATKIGLLGCALLLATGLGWYLRHYDEANLWLRSAGRRERAEDEVIVEQRKSAELPGFEGKVKVHLGDMKRGRTADVDILGPNANVLARRKNAQVGDRLEFAHEGKKYEVEVLEYRDKLASGDRAKLRVVPLADENPPTAVEQEKASKDGNQEGK